MVKTDHNLIRNFTLYGRDRTAMSVQHNSMQGYRYCQSGKIDSNKYHCGVTAASTCFLSANAGSAVIAENLCPDRCRVRRAVAPRGWPEIVRHCRVAAEAAHLAGASMVMPGAAGTAAAYAGRDGSAGTALPRRQRSQAVAGLIAGPGSLSVSLQPWQLMAHRWMDQGHLGTSALSD